MNGLKFWWPLIACVALYLGYQELDRYRNPPEPATPSLARLGKQYSLELRDLAKRAVLHASTSPIADAGQLVDAMRSDIDGQMESAWKPIAAQLEIQAGNDTAKAKQLLAEIAKGMP